MPANHEVIFQTRGLFIDSRGMRLKSEAHATGQEYDEDVEDDNEGDSDDDDYDGNGRKVRLMQQIKHDDNDDGGDVNGVDDADNKQ